MILANLPKMYEQFQIILINVARSCRIHCLI
jgi:hypothetical protein